MVDFFKQTPADIEYKVRNFDFLAEFMSNKWNPFYYFAEWVADYLGDQADAYFIWGLDITPDDEWLAIFKDDIYGAFYTHLVYTTRPSVAFTKWMIGREPNDYFPAWWSATWPFSLFYVPSVE